MTQTASAAAAGTIRVGEREVNRLGLGTNRITDTPQNQALLKRALELGINFIDTAYTYRDGASELTIGKTLSPFPEDIVVATKGGMHGASPERLESELNESLERLQTSSIYLYQLHRLDREVPLETSVGALQHFQQQGKISHIGLSEVTIDEIERARAVTPIVSVQNEYNIVKRQHEEVLDYCTDNGIVFIPWFPLGGLSGDKPQADEMMRELAHKYSATPEQIALAWLLKRSPMMLPIPGTLSLEHLESNLHGGTLLLSDEDYQSLLELS